MFDHIGYNVTNFEGSKRFYLTALAPLGHGLMAEGEGWAIIGGKNGRLWIGAFGPAPGQIHLAFTAESRDQVREFYSAALSSGGLDNGAPGIRENDGPNYYAAFVLDPDGHNVEAVCHRESE